MKEQNTGKKFKITAITQALLMILAVSGCVANPNPDSGTATEADSAEDWFQSSGQ